MNNTVKVSSLIKSQLPNFIVDDSSYSTFVSFLEAYYEWMEQSKNVLSESKNLLDYIDVDKTLDEFLDYFYGEFLPSFPLEIVSDKRKLLKFAKEFHQQKGTKNSYEFLFRVLYDSECQVIETKDFVLKASDGKWFAPKSVKIKSADERFLLTENLFLFGETSKTLAKIERAIVSADKIEIFVSDIERIFNIGEYIRVVDFNSRNVLFDTNGKIVEKNGDILRARISSSIASLNIEKKFRGNYYTTGNPVVFYGGLKNPLTEIGAEALVGEVTTGSILRAVLDKTYPAYGYRYPYTAVYVNPDPDKKTIVQIGSVDPDTRIDLDFIITDSLQLKEHVILNCDMNTGTNIDSETDYGFTELFTANANTIMSDVFTFSTIDTYTADSFVVMNGGGGFDRFPRLSAQAMYRTNLPYSYALLQDPRYNFDMTEAIPYTYESLAKLGILGPIQIGNGGLGYQVGDEIEFYGIGTAAFANVTSVYANGKISAISYYQKPSYKAPIGGFGWSDNPYPTLKITPRQTVGTIQNGSDLLVVSSLENTKVGQTVIGNGLPANTKVSIIYTGNTTLKLSNTSTGTYISNTYLLTGNGANIYVNSIMGGSANVNPITDRIGSITTFDILNYGEDYYTAPSVSLKIQDFVVSNIPLNFVPSKGDILYNNSLFYKSFVDSVTKIQFNENPLLEKYIIRTYNYNKKVNINKQVTLQKLNIPSPNTRNLIIDNTYTFPMGYFGIKEKSIGSVTFGDGTAKALAKFLNGLILGQGSYLDKSGQPSSYNVLENMDYNSFSYILSVDKEISKYKKILMELLHPAGTKVIGQVNINPQKPSNKIKSESEFARHLNEDYEFLYYLIGSEKNSLYGHLTSEYLTFQSSISKYCSLIDSKTLKIYPISTEIAVGKQIWGQGIPGNTFIEKVNLDNTIFISNDCTDTISEGSFSVNNVVDFQTSYTALNYNFTGNIQIGSNVVSIIVDSTNILDGLFKNQKVKCDPTIIMANIKNNSPLLTNVVPFGPISIGQEISSNFFPNGTYVISYDNNSAIITLSNTATANHNPTKSYYDYLMGQSITKNCYIQLYNTSNTTKITAINSSANTITLNNSISSNPTSNIFYFIGDGYSMFGANSFIAIRSELDSIPENVI